MNVAALYVDVQRGPYASIPDVDCWGVERDATLYAGPWPVVAHPPCGHWGRYAHKAHDDGHTGPIAVAQVRQFGGVLEHPRDSKLWRECGLPLPGWLPDAWGGYTVEVFQRDWGHRADKPTWLYVVGCPVADLPPMPEPQPPRQAWTPSRRVLDPARLESARPRGARGIVECMSKAQRHLTPPAFAQWLVDVAMKCGSRSLAVGRRVLVHNECDCQDCAGLSFNLRSGIVVAINGDMVDVKADGGDVDCWPVEWVTVMP